MKVCFDCKRSGDIFSPRGSYCRNCAARRAREWRLNNLARAKAYDKKRSKQRYLENRDAILEWQAKYRDSNRAKVNAYKELSRKRNLPKYADKENRRRARIKQNGVEFYSRLEVFDRDRGLCYICLKSIDILKHWPDPKSFSVDHIIPISKGGADKMDNVRSTHLICNVKKSNREEVS